MVVAAGLAVASNAHATVTEPNGTVVPLDSANGEVQLYTLFSSLAEPVDWTADAHTTPDTFSPLCGFTAKFLLHEAGSNVNVGWYNVVPGATAAPTLAEIHTIVPAGSPVGTTITGADIRKDPAYAGGSIGFAITGGQTHYSEQKWNVNCSGCAAPGPWALAVIYQSKKTANAYYLCFEDGNVDSSSFGNDGDFNDDVFEFTGLVCAASGKACDTGKKGTCAFGATSCVDGKEVCKDAVLPSTKQCNGLDNDCDGKIDDGPCPDGTICTKGACIPKCNDGEFKCTGGLVCDAGICVEPSCVGKTCPDGQTCVAGACVDACTGVTCPFGQVCRVGVCVDPCASLKCGTDEVCEGGLCKPGCACAGCATGKTCDTTTQKCNPTACAGKTCPAGTHCIDDGSCADSCTGVKCPKGQECAAGACKPSASTGDGGVGDGGLEDVGLTVDSGDPFGDGALHPPDSGDGAGFGPSDDVQGSCGCRVVGTGDDDRATRSSAAWFAALAFGVAAVSRRRRSIGR